MFICEYIKEQDFDSVVLKETTGTSIGIIPSCGGILHSFTVNMKNGSLFNVIDSYSNKDDFFKNVESGGFKSCKLSPFACRVNKAVYNFNNKDYKLDKFLLGNNALHGLLYDCSFSVINMQANQYSASVNLLHEYKATDKGYPFNYDCIITYELQRENTLIITTEIINKSETSIPMQDGWHPYFTFGNSIDNLFLEFQSVAMLEFDNELIPTGDLILYNEFNTSKKIGTTIFDNCFTLNFNKDQPLCVLKDLDKRIQLEIYPDKNYPYLQLYTPAHRKSIAIENLSAAPDAFNNRIGLKILQPGEKAEFTTSYTLRGL